MGQLNDLHYITKWCKDNDHKFISFHEKGYIIQENYSTMTTEGNYFFVEKDDEGFFMVKENPFKGIEKRRKQNAVD
jgi:hypothetical protein